MPVAGEGVQLLQDGEEGTLRSLRVAGADPGDEGGDAQVALVEGPGGAGGIVQEGDEQAPARHGTVFGFEVDGEVGGDVLVEMGPAGNELSDACKEVLTELRRCGAVRAGLQETAREGIDEGGGAEETGGVAAGLEGVGVGARGAGAGTAATVVDGGFH